MSVAGCTVGADNMAEADIVLAVGMLTVALVEHAKNLTVFLLDKAMGCVELLVCAAYSLLHIRPSNQ
jgi:hypothetical protein